MQNGPRGIWITVWNDNGAPQPRAARLLCAKQAGGYDNLPNGFWGNVARWFVSWTAVWAEFDLRTSTIPQPMQCSVLCSRE
jgi:hypothetical protein